MRITIDEDILMKEGVDIRGFMALLAIYMRGIPTKEDMESICRNGYIVYTNYYKGFPENAKLTQTGIDFVESILLKCEHKSTDTPMDKYIQMAEAMRDLYPQGVKPGRHDSWKSSAPVLATRLRALEKKYKVKLDLEKVKKATEDYVRSFNGDYTYMQLLKYFIIKKDVDTGAESSRLLEALEEHDMRQEEGLSPNYYEFDNIV